MSSEPWSRLAAPFPVAALAWHAVTASSDGTRLLLAPHLPAPALRARLDAVVGPAEWSLTMRPWGDDGLVAELTVAGAKRAAAVRTRAAGGTGAAAEGAAVPAGSEASDAAFSAAAAGFGMLPPVEVADDGWVDSDPETGEALHAPETRPRTASGPMGTTDRVPRPEPELAELSGADPAGQGAPGSADAEAAAAPSTDAPPREAPEGEAAKPEAHRVIDRLVERLREEGLGAEAAKLVLSYGGYGRDAERSRELYARLRALLIERGTHA